MYESMLNTKRWLVGGVAGTFMLSALLLSGPGDAGAQEATPTATTEATSEPTVTNDTVSQADTSNQFSIGDLVAVSDGPLNLRDEASINGAVVTQFATGTRLTIVNGPTSADDFDWYEVESSAGDTGWVAGEFLEETSVAAFSKGDTVQVIDGPLNARDDAAANATVVTQLETGDTGEVLSGPIVNDGYDWYKIQINSSTNGWVAADFIGAASSDEEFSADDVIEVIDGQLNVRVEAGTSAEVVTQLETGDTATVLSGPESADDLTWYEVEIDSETTGWVASDFIALAGNEPSSGSDETIAIGDGVRVSVDGMNLRADAGLDADVIGTLDENALLLVQDGPIEADGYTWYRVFNYYYGDGWVAGELLTVDPDGFPGE